MTRLDSQLLFILELDRLKSVMRRTRLLSGDRYENSAEHSWHLAMMALVLHEHANRPSDRPLDLLRVLKMLLVHDIVEIDAGDTFAYDKAGHASKVEREQGAAERIFGLLPDDQEQEMRALWDEFEERATSEARFAAALDRLMPLLHNAHGGGASWREHGIVLAQVEALATHVGDGSNTLAEVVDRLLDESVALGLLKA